MAAFLLDTTGIKIEKVCHRSPVTAYTYLSVQLYQRQLGYCSGT